MLDSFIILLVDHHLNWSALRKHTEADFSDF
jgi:hypothetical protein